VEGPAAGRQEHCSIYCPLTKFTALYEREETFCPPAAQLGCFTKAIPAAPGRDAQRAPFFPAQNVFLNKVSVQVCSVGTPELCSTLGTRAQADPARRPITYLIRRASLLSGQLSLILLSVRWRSLAHIYRPSIPAPILEVANPLPPWSTRLILSIAYFSPSF